MNVLVVSSYPPMACGIGKYAEQQVAALRREGHVVDVFSPPEGAGDFQTNLHGGLRPLRLLSFLWAYDEAYLHYTPHFFYDSQSKADRLLTSLAFLLLMRLRGRRLSFIIHETGYRLKGGPPDAATAPDGRASLRRWIDRWWWRLARRVVFHSRRERDAFGAYYRLAPERKAFEIWPHDQFFQRRTTLDHAAARRALGVEPDVTLLLCIGFIQPHKGFERPIHALRRAPEAARLRLKIVGSVRLDWDEAHAYARELHEMAESDSRCEVIETWLSDELFDTWIVAADYVVVPYHEIWSSGVAARAKLYGRPIIASATGGLDEQLTPGSILFADDAELETAIHQIADR